LYKASPQGISSDTDLELVLAIVDIVLTRAKDDVVL
jgi:hypothetical protein